MAIDVWEAWISVYEFISANIISGLRFAREKAQGVGPWANGFQASKIGCASNIMSFCSYSDTTVGWKKSGESLEIYETLVKNRRFSR